MLLSTRETIQYGRKFDRETQVDVGAGTPRLAILQFVQLGLV